VSRKEVPHQSIPKNYDVFAESPIETGINQYQIITVDKRDYELTKESAIAKNKLTIVLLSKIIKQKKTIYIMDRFKLS
jgi:hypothetical protein